MTACIICGDPHIGGSTSIGKIGIGSALNSRVVDRINLLEWLLEQAIDNNARDIIITGDVFEEPKPHPTLITLLMSWLKKCSINSINVHIIRGNHDIFRTGNYYTSPLDIVAECDLDNVSIYKDIDTIFIENVAFTFIPFKDRKSYNVESNAEALSLLKDSLVYELAGIPVSYKKIVVGHLALEGSIPVGDEIDDLTNEIFCPLDMFQGYDYVWMGHVHKPQIMKKVPYLAHVGSMDTSNFGETDHKKYVILFDIDDVDNFAHVNLPTRPLKKISISIPEGTSDTTQYVIDEINKNKDLSKSVVKLEVHLLSPELLSINRVNVEKHLYNNGVFHVASISESKKLAPIKKDESVKMDMSLNVPAAIKVYAESQIDKDKRDSFIEAAIDIFNQFKLENDE